MAKRRMGLIAFLVCFFICLAPCQVGAASTTNAKEPIFTDKDCSLTISYSYEDNVFSDLSVRLYKIAEVSADYQYTLTPAFEKSKLALNGIRSLDEWKVIRSTLETYILANKITADFDILTNSEGKVSFDALKTGLYLAITDGIVKDEATYIFDSALISLPVLDSDNLWQYNVVAKAKCKVIPPAEADEETEYKVTKLWKGDDAKANRPESVELEIFHNGKSYKKVKLSDENNWTYSWQAKDDGSDWKVIERNIPSGYTMTVEKRENAFVMVNTLERDDTVDSDAPQTGDTSNFMLWVVLMIISGSLLIIIGFTGKRNRV